VKKYLQTSLEKYLKNRGAGEKYIQTFLEKYLKISADRKIRMPKQ
jgi:hypothetical protein